MLIGYIKYLRILTKLSHGVAAMVVGIMLLHITADVLGRALFGFPSPATTEFVSYYYMIAIVFLPLAEIERNDNNIVVDVFYKSRKKLAKRLMLIVGLSCTVIFFGLLTWQSWADALDAYSKNEMVDGYYTVIIWPARFGMALAFTLISLTAVLRLYYEVAFGRQAEADSNTPTKFSNQNEII